MLFTPQETEARARLAELEAETQRLKADLKTALAAWRRELLTKETT